MREEIINFNKKYREERHILVKKLREWVVDKNIPLEERWKTFLMSNLGDTSDRTEFGLDRDDKFLYEGPCYLSKYETQSVESILDNLKSDRKFNLTEEEEIIFKEYCLDDFICNMKFDW